MAPRPGRSAGGRAGSHSQLQQSDFYLPPDGSSREGRTRQI